MPEIRLPIIQRLASIGNLAIALKTSGVGVAAVALFYQDLGIIFNDACMQHFAFSHPVMKNFNSNA
jgi:hypothetical protein